MPGLRLYKQRVSIHTDLVLLPSLPPTCQLCGPG
jgi:hypothetical protein